MVARRPTRAVIAKRARASAVVGEKFDVKADTGHGANCTTSVGLKRPPSRPIT